LKTAEITKLIDDNRIDTRHFYIVKTNFNTFKKGTLVKLVGITDSSGVIVCHPNNKDLIKDIDNTYVLVSSIDNIINIEKYIGKNHYECKNAVLTIWNTIFPYTKRYFND
jgi:hypothetical protein